MPTIYFDMDGTIADLYSVNDWLARLRSNDPSPYIKANPMVNMRLLALRLNRLQRIYGYKLGIVSWLSMGSNSYYDELVRLYKRKWLQKHLQSVQWDEIHLVKYGTPKHLVVHDRSGILFDDNHEVRQKWKGEAHDETQILEILRQLTTM